MLSDPDQRSSRRDHILMLAKLRVGGNPEPLTIRIRDLSAGGLRAQFSGPRLGRARLAVEIRNIGWVEGSVAWQNDEYIGIRFDTAINPERSRIAVTGSFPPPVHAIQRRV